MQAFKSSLSTLHRAAALNMQRGARRPATVYGQQISSRPLQTFSRRAMSSNPIPKETAQKLNVAGLEMPASVANLNTNKILFSIIAGVVVLGAGSKFVATVPAGNVGVVDTFGKVDEKALYPGLHLINPLARVSNFSCKTHSENYKFTAPSSEGLEVGLGVALRYKLSPEAVVDLYNTVGPDFIKVLISPLMNSVVRQVTCMRTSKELYTSDGRTSMRNELFKVLTEALSDRGIIVEEVLMSKIELPHKLTSAIERKLEMEQESQRMSFVLQRESAEAERKAIEAKGIHDFQTIVSKGITESLLRWKGIEATERLAASPNAKIVVVGGGKDGLPIIMNTSK